jgi:hypothetical protein
MTICPIAIVAGCAKCPAFKICPLKGVLGDKPPVVEAKMEAKSKAKAKANTPAKAKRKVSKK